MSDYLDFTKEWLPKIDLHLQQCLNDIEKGTPKPLLDSMHYSLLSEGKRMRPLIVLMACEASGGNCADALPAASAVEMVHAFSLIHDDLPAMDDDDMRRGQPTNHKVYGEGEAILAGDSLFSLAFSTLAQGIDDAAISRACCMDLSLASGALGMGGGQSDDLRGLAEQSTLEDLESLHRRKTGALIEASLRMGARIGNATDEQLSALQDFGWRIGLAFQIVDDLLDAEGESAALGKEAGKDAAQGKLTFPALLGIDLSTEKATQLITDAHDVLSVFGDKVKHLHDLADLVVSRDK